MKVECPCGGLDDGNGFGCILQALHDYGLKGLGLCSHETQKTVTYSGFCVVSEG